MIYELEFEPHALNEWKKLGRRPHGCRNRANCGHSNRTLPTDYELSSEINKFTIKQCLIFYFCFGRAEFRYLSDQ